MAIIQNIKSYVKRFELVLLMMFLGTMILLSFLQIIFRKVFGSSIPHADQIVTMSVMYIGLTGASLATLEDKHITIEVLSKFVSDKVNTIMAVLFNLFSAYIIYILFTATQEYIGFQEESIDFFIGTLRTVTVESFILPGFFLIGFGFILNFIENIILLVNGEAK